MYERFPFWKGVPIKICWRRHDWFKKSEVMRFFRKLMLKNPVLENEERKWETNMAAMWNI